MKKSENKSEKKQKQEVLHFAAGMLDGTFYLPALMNKLPLTILFLCLQRSDNAIKIRFSKIQ